MILKVFVTLCWINIIGWAIVESLGCSHAQYIDGIACSDILEKEEYKEIREICE